MLNETWFSLSYVVYSNLFKSKFNYIVLKKFLPPNLFWNLTFGQNLVTFHTVIVTLIFGFKETCEANSYEINGHPLE